MLGSENHPTPTVFAGLDVGKSFHHLCALSADGTRVFDRKVNNDEAELRVVLTQLLQRGPVLLLSAFAALKVPASRAYYDKRRAEGKRHNAVLICLSRRPVDVLHAVLRNGQHYRTPTPNTAHAA